MPWTIEHEKLLISGLFSTTDLSKQFFHYFNLPSHYYSLSNLNYVKNVI